MHNQPGRLVRVPLRSPFGPSADRLTTLEGLGNLGWSWPWENDEPLGTDEEAQAGAESDTDWTGFVTDLVKAVSPAAKEAIKGAFMQTKAGQGLSQTEIGRLIGLGEQRAAGVQAGTASMPAAGWIGIGVGAVAILGLVLFFAMGRRKNPCPEKRHRR